MGRRCAPAGWSAGALNPGTGAYRSGRHEMAQSATEKIHLCHEFVYTASRCHLTDTSPDSIRTSTIRSASMGCDFTSGHAGDMRGPVRRSSKTRRDSQSCDRASSPLSDAGDARGATARHLRRPWRPSARGFPNEPSKGRRPQTGVMLCRRPVRGNRIWARWASFTIAGAKWASHRVVGWATRVHGEGATGIADARSNATRERGPLRRPLTPTRFRQDRRQGSGRRSIWMRSSLRLLPLDRRRARRPR